MSETLKLIRKPSRFPVNFKYVKTWERCTFSILSTDFSSHMMRPSTRTSRRNPSLNLIPSYIKGTSLVFYETDRAFQVHDMGTAHRHSPTSLLPKPYVLYKPSRQSIGQSARPPAEWELWVLSASL